MLIVTNSKATTLTMITMYMRIPSELPVLGSVIKSATVLYCTCKVDHRLWRYMFLFNIPSRRYLKIDKEIPRNIIKMNLWLFVFAQVSDRLRIAGSSTMLVVPSVGLSPRDRQSYVCKNENCTNFDVLLGIKISGDNLIANLVSISSEDQSLEKIVLETNTPLFNVQSD